MNVMVRGRSTRPDGRSTTQKSALTRSDQFHMARRTCSESNIIQAQEDISSPGKTAGPDTRKLYVNLKPAVNRQPMFPRGWPEELAESYNVLNIQRVGCTHI